MWFVNDGTEFQTTQEAQAYINQTDPSWHIRLRVDPNDIVPESNYKLRIRDYPERWNNELPMAGLHPESNEDNENN